MKCIRCRVPSAETWGSDDQPKPSEERDKVTVSKMPSGELEKLGSK